MSEPHLSKADLAARLKISKRSVDRLRAAGKLPEPLYVGRQARWTVAALETWELRGGSKVA
jgi:predicted DNA-binding transcriptional regulator AlpA